MSTEITQNTVMLMLAKKLLNAPSIKFFKNVFQGKRLTVYINSYIMWIFQGTLSEK